MIKIVRLKGGLGNQMFQYAFFLSLKKKYPLSWYVFDSKEAIDCIHGIMLDDVFDINISDKARRYCLIRKYLPIILRHAFYLEQENTLKFKITYLSKRKIITIYDGYWQSEKYFSTISKRVHKTFHFRKELMCQRTKQLAEKIKNGCYTSIHIRRGDYLPLADYHGICSEEYYQRAMYYMRKKYINTTFVFFSDDIEWVQDNLKEEGAIYVDWNKGKDSWQDMYLMSCCKHNIVANSSFSWWGAWLNRNPGKVVIAPSQWFKFTPNHDIIPDNWILL